MTKYLKEGFYPSSSYYNATIHSKIKPNATDIKDMLCEMKTFKQISAAIREKGCYGSDSTIRMFATKERKIMKETARQETSGEKIERKWLVSLLYRPIFEVPQRGTTRAYYRGIPYHSPAL